MQFTPSQQDALNIENHICVTAGAGSGKTAVLVERYLTILRDANVSPQQVVAITFTDKAAAEMKSRVIEKLSDDENTNIRNMYLEQMNSAPISTIHTFCANILREFPFQAGVPANFSILQGIDQKLLLRQIIKSTLKQIAENPEDEHYPILECTLQRLRDGKQLVDTLTSMVEDRYVLANLIQDVYCENGSERIPEAWIDAYRSSLLSESEIEEFITCLTIVLQIARGKNADTVKDLTIELKQLPNRNSDSPEVLNLLSEIAQLITTKNNGIGKQAFLGTRLDTSEVETEISFLVTAAIKIKSIPSILNPNKANDQEETDDEFLLQTTHAILTLYNRIYAQYQEEKLLQGKLDFEDLQLRTRDLLQNNQLIRQKLLARHKYYMVDEFQDTNELQYELVMLLTNYLDDANLFIVGDPKQSIYGFRGADVNIFNKTRNQISNNGGLTISLTENFRSLRHTVGFTNHFFNALMGDGTESDYEVPYEPLTKARNVDADGKVEIIFSYNNDESTSEPTLIAKHIKKLIADKEKIWVKGEDREEQPKLINYGDIAILIRARTHLPDIENALHLAGIPYLTTGGVGFYQRQEIYDIWNYLDFLNNPKENNTSLIGVLRGPAFGISDVELYGISLQQGDSLWEKTKKYHRPTDQLTTAKDTLKNHIQVAHRLPINQLIQSIVNDTGLIGTLRLGRQGPQRWANYQKLLDLARNYDADEAKQTLVDFIEFLDILITEEPREGDAPVEESRTAVQIMTIHSAKGKQFPIVILPSLERKGRSTTEPFIDDQLGLAISPYDPCNSYTKTEPEIVELMKTRAQAKDIAEKKRQLYVGATRAEDKLILAGSLDNYGNLQNMLKWIYVHLGISKEDNLLSLNYTLKVYSGGNTPGNSIEQHIPIISRIDDVTNETQLQREDTTENYPEMPSFPDRQLDFSESFTITELADYMHCPLRYQLEHILRIPYANNQHTDWDEVDIDNAIRFVLDNIQQQRDMNRLDDLCDTAIQNIQKPTSTSTSTEFKEILHTQTNNFLSSELGINALSVSDAKTKLQIHADINGHIISGRFDRIYQDQTGQYQIIKYKNRPEENVESCQPEMGLYALLFSRVYPNKPNVNVHFYFTSNHMYESTSNNLHEKMCFNITGFHQASSELQETIRSLQRGNFEKKVEHCCSCPYADAQGQCIVA